MQIILSSRIIKKQATNWIWPSSLYQRFPSCPDLTGISVHHKALGRRLSIRDIHSSKAQKPSRPLIRLSSSEGGPGQATYPPQISVFSTYKMWTRPPLSQGCCTDPASIHLLFHTLKHLFCARLHPAPRSSQVYLVARTPFVDIVWICFWWSFL